MKRKTGNKVAIIGSGKIAKSICYDIEKNENVSSVVILTTDLSEARDIEYWINSKKIRIIEIEEIKASTKELEKHIKNCDLVFSCVPYFVNKVITRACITQKCHMIDLGGNNAVVSKQLDMNSAAEDKEVLIVPDCGVAPGLVSVFAKKISEEFDKGSSIYLRVGGLPKNPIPPLNYSLTFSVSGLINEYIEPCVRLKDHEVQSCEPLEDKEDIDFAEYWDMEAFNTSGGTSTLPNNLSKKVKNIDYKTIRYGGHCSFIRALYKLGMMNDDPDGMMPCSPREVVEERLHQLLPVDEEDVLLLRVIGSGLKKKKPTMDVYEIVDYFDQETGLSAMQRMTGFPCTVLAGKILDGTIKTRGVKTQELFVPHDEILEGLIERGIDIRIKSAENPKDNNGQG